MEATTPPPPPEDRDQTENDMARKTTSTKTTKSSTKTTTRPKTIVEDPGFVAPKPKKAEPIKTQTLAEALAEAGQTMADLAPVAKAEKAERQVGTSNLAATIRSHRKSYNPMLHPNGKKTQNNGDQVAVLLLPIPLPTLQAFAAVRFDGRSYAHLNPGHARMCIGNLIRAAAKKGEQDVLDWLDANQPKAEQQA